MCRGRQVREISDFGVKVLSRLGRYVVASIIPVVNSSAHGVQHKPRVFPKTWPVAWAHWPVARSWDRPQNPSRPESQEMPICRHVEGL